MPAAAGEEPFDDVLLDAALEPAARLQFRRMPDSALVQRRGARFARPVFPASGSQRRMLAPLHASSNAALLQRGVQLTPVFPRGFVRSRKDAERTPAESPIRLTGPAAVESFRDARDSRCQGPHRLSSVIARP